MKGSENGKNPSVNWIFNDWQGGTMTMSRHHKGCYMDLLTAQFNNGHISLDEIKTVLGSDFGTAWPTLQKKFVPDERGLYYNKRLEAEILKKKNYSKSREDNLNSEESSPHMGNGNEAGLGKEVWKQELETVYPFDSEEFRTTWDLWVMYKKQQFKFVYKPIGMQGALKELVELSGGNQTTAIKIIIQSIQKGWKGFFKLQQQNGKQTGGFSDEEILAAAKRAASGVHGL